VVGALMRSEEARIEVIGLGLDAEQFHYRPYKLAFEEVVERYYADDPIDPLTIAEAIAPRAAEMWSISEREAVDKFVALSAQVFEGSPADHVKIIKHHADLQALIGIAANALHEASYQERSPEEIAGVLSTEAAKIVTGALTHSESHSFGELGRRWTRQKQEEIAARAAGVELGARYGIAAIDQYVKGHRPSELFILGGDAGIGKSALAWAMGRNFALSQMKQAPERRIGTLILSLEMGEEPSSSRFAQMEARFPGEKLREGDLTRAELTAIAAKWAAHRELPLWVNHSGELRESQLKAIVVDHVRRHNVGVVIIDHFRFITTDERFRDKNDADEQIVKFLKANLAKDLNLAVTCLAHTRDIEVGRRPTMNDLRGNKMISAFADLVAFPYSPWRASSVHERERDLVAREDFELIWAKVRQGAEGVGELYMDLSTQTVR
jgi:replicative DNA helicase